MKTFILLLGLFSFINIAYSQNVGIGTPTPANAALLDLQDTERALRLTLRQRHGPEKVSREKG